MRNTAYGAREGESKSLPRDPGFRVRATCTQKVRGPLLAEGIFHIIDSHHELDLMERLIGLRLVLLIQHRQVVIHLYGALAVLVFSRGADSLAECNYL